MLAGSEGIDSISSNLSPESQFLFIWRLQQNELTHTENMEILHRWKAPEPPTLSDTD